MHHFKFSDATMVTFYATSNMKAGIAPAKVTSRSVNKIRKRIKKLDNASKTVKPRLKPHEARALRTPLATSYQLADAAEAIRIDLNHREKISSILAARKRSKTLDRKEEFRAKFAPPPTSEFSPIIRKTFKRCRNTSMDYQFYLKFHAFRQTREQFYLAPFAGFATKSVWEFDSLTQFKFKISGKIRTCSWPSYNKAFSSGNLIYCDQFLIAFNKVCPVPLKPKICPLKPDIVEIINDWYDDSEENKQIRRVLFQYMTSEDNAAPCQETAAPCQMMDGIKGVMNLLTDVSGDISEIAEAARIVKKFRESAEIIQPIDARSVKSMLAVLCASAATACSLQSPLPLVSGFLATYLMMPRKWQDDSYDKVLALFKSFFKELYDLGSDAIGAFDAPTHLAKFVSEFQGSGIGFDNLAAKAQSGSGWSITQIFQCLTGFFGEDLETRWAQYSMPIMQFFTGLLTIILAFTMGDFDLSVSGIVGYIKGHFGKVFRKMNYNNIIECFKGVFTIADDTLWMVLFGRTRADFTFEKTHGNLPEVMELYRTFLETTHPIEEVSTNTTSANLFAAMHLKMQKSKVSADRALSQQITDLLREGKHCYEKARITLNGSSDTRPTPACIMFHGTPNTGKTILTKHVGVDVANRALTDPELVKREARNCECTVEYGDCASSAGATATLKRDPKCCVPHRTFISEDTPEKDFMYVLNVDEKFWPGYYNQFICLSDEVFCMRDSEGKPDPTYDVINRAVNTAPWPLEMADCAEKGTAFFTSSLLLMTTNAKGGFVEPVSRNPENVEALRRRIHLSVKVEVVKTHKASIEQDGKWYHQTFNFGVSRQAEGRPAQTELDEVEVDRFRKWSGRDESAFCPEIYKLTVTEVIPGTDGGSKEYPPLLGANAFRDVCDKLFARFKKNSMRHKVKCVKTSSNLRKAAAAQAGSMIEIFEDAVEYQQDQEHEYADDEALLQLDDLSNNERIEREEMLMEEMLSQFKKRLDQERRAFLKPDSPAWARPNYFQEGLNKIMESSMNCYQKIGKVFSRERVLWMLKIGTMITGALLLIAIPVAYAWTRVECLFKDAMANGDVARVFSTRRCEKECTLCGSLNERNYKLVRDNRGPKNGNECYASVPEGRDYVRQIHEVFNKAKLPVGAKFIASIYNIEQKTFRTECFFNCFSHEFGKDCPHDMSPATAQVGHPTKKPRKKDVYDKLRGALQDQLDEEPSASRAIIATYSMFREKQIPTKCLDSLQAQIQEPTLYLVYACAITDLGQWCCKRESENPDYHCEDVTAKITLDDVFPHSAETAEHAIDMYDVLPVSDQNCISVETEHSRLRMQMEQRDRRLRTRCRNQKEMPVLRTDAFRKKIEFDQKIANNQVMITCQRCSASATGLFVVGTTLLINKHIYASCLSGKHDTHTLSYRRPYEDSTQVKEVGIVKVLQNGCDRDWVLVELDGACGNNYANIVGCFVREADVNKLKNRMLDGYVYQNPLVITNSFRKDNKMIKTYLPTANRMYPREDMTEREQLVSMHACGDPDGPPSYYKSQRIMTFTATNEYGWCGSPTILNNSGMSTIVGIHSAGKEVESHTSIVTFEELEDALTLVEEQHKITNTDFVSAGIRTRQ
jgi:hypothetical protein